MSAIVQAEKALIEGDLGRLTADERLAYYREVCSSLGLNPLTRPFDYIRLNNKLVLYAKRDCADQLRRLHNITLEVVSRSIEDGVLTVHVRASMPAGADSQRRSDEDFGAVSVTGLKGEAMANAVLKAVTKAKRRVTLSLCGLGFLDETEVESIQAAEQPQQEALPAPKRRPTIAEGVAAYERKLAAEGLCESGELGQHLVELLGGEEGLGPDIAGWPPEAADAVRAACRQFAEGARKAKAAGQPA
jgi:hypothetical protein